MGAGAIVAGALGALSGGRDEGGAELPPVQEIRLERAAHVASCRLRGGASATRPRSIADGGAPRAAQPGAYRTPVNEDALLAALRRGVIVIQYRAGIAPERLGQLTALQARLPAGTILAPNEAATPYEVAVMAWRRMLRCPRLDGVTMDAIRLFRGRFVGSAPR
jgi:hypothetical protein